MSSTPENTTTTSTSNNNNNTASQIYDRQIRLWGAQAQAKLQQAHILYIHVTGVSIEVLKNLVLAGLKVSLYDPRPFPDAVISTPNVLLPASEKLGLTTDNDETDLAEGSNKRAKLEQKTVAHALQKPVEELNPLLGECNIVETSLEQIVNNTDNVLSPYTVVIASRLSKTQAVTLSKTCTDSGKKVFILDSFGMNGSCIMDLGKDHTYRPEVGKELMDPESLGEKYVSITTSLLDTPLEKAVNRFHKQAPPVAWIQHYLLLEFADKHNGWPDKFDTDEFVAFATDYIRTTSPLLLSEEKNVTCVQPEALKQLAKVATAEIAPVCSILGGMVGNEVVKAIGGRGTPANNTLLFDGTTCKGWTFLVKSAAVQGKK